MHFESLVFLARPLSLLKGPAQVTDMIQFHLMCSLDL